jgi:hypothetical protein
MTTTALIDRPEAPAGPPKLTPAQLRVAQAQTLDAPRMRYGILARALFKATDLVYGREGGIVKFVMLEYIARVPYQAWERIGTWPWPGTGGVRRSRGGSSSALRRPALNRTTSSGTC